MTSVRLTGPVARPADEVWASIADVGAVHERLARGFVVATELEGDERVVTFDNGAVARELLVDLDDGAMRAAYAVIDSPFAMRHHHATMEVVPDGADRCVLTWVADIAPDAIARTLDAGR